jgi:glutathione synthase/RimK-type ligase-like ATP-grasp enzyme
MNTLIVTDQDQPWLDVPGATVLTARGYFAERESELDADVRLLNFCRTGRYQGRGYYVSLLAQARGQRPLPDVKTVEFLKSRTYVQELAARLQALVDETLRHAESDRFELDVYLGRDPAGRQAAIAEQIFAAVRAPLIRSVFIREAGSWRLDSLQAISVADIPPQHRESLLEAAKRFVAASAPSMPRSARTSPPKLAILHDPKEPLKASNDEALQRFLHAAPAVGLEAELICHDDLPRLGDFDALFSRASPEVTGITYEFVRRAEALGMPVVDDPGSILKCVNKVFMHELMGRHRIAQPRTLIVHRGNLDEVVPTLGLPCVLKLPDSGFGLDVVKLESEDGLREAAERFFKVSELIVAQQWLPTSFDWRVGVFDRRPLFVSKYFMAPGHWKVVAMAEGKPVEGETVTMSVGEAPSQVVDIAVRAANLVGDGLYGVDLKQVEDRVYLIEVNCNPNIDAGNEDAAMGDALYREVLGVFARRIAERRNRCASA